MDIDKIDKLINIIVGNSAVASDVVEAAMQEIMKITDEQLPMLIRPKVCYSEATAVVLTRIGYPRIKDIIPDLLRWLQDINWPGAYEIAKLLASIGKPVVPYIKDILRGTDDTWQLWVIKYVIDEWPKEFVVEIQSELEYLTRIINLSEGIDVESLKVLAIHGLIERKRISSFCHATKFQLSQHVQRLEELEKYC